MAVGILNLSQRSFVKIFEPSNWAAILLGPKTFILFFSKKSVIPFTKGFSGPTMIKSIFLSNINFFNFSKLSVSNLIFSGKGIASLGFDNWISTISQFLILNEGLLTILPSTFSCLFSIKILILLLEMEKLFW